MTMNFPQMDPELPEAAESLPDVSSVIPPEQKREHTMTLRRLYTRRFLRSKGGMLGLVILILLTLFSIFGGFLTKWNYSTPDFTALTSSPGGSHYFGTDTSGNDTYAQCVHGLQRSLVIAVSVSALTTIISAVVGAWAAYVGGRLERWTLAVIHFLLVIPTFLILALVAQHYSGDWRILIVVLTIFGWMFSARIIWSLATSLREREYVTAAQFMGVSSWRIVVRHIIPNIGSLLIINFTLGVVGTVFTETGLSFIGFGVQPPDVSLGSMLADGSDSVSSAPWLFLFPSLLIVLLTVSMALIGDGLRDALDPNSKAGGNA